MDEMSVDEVVQLIMKIHRSLPARPVLDEVVAAKGLIKNLEKEDQMRIEMISKQKKNKDVPDELFNISQEMQKTMVYFNSQEQKTEAIKLLDLENLHQLFDELVQRASNCISGNSNSNSFVQPSSQDSVSSYSANGYNSSAINTKTSSFDGIKPSEKYTKDDSFLKKSKTSFRSENEVFNTPQIVDSSLKSVITSAKDGEKLSLIKLANLIEVNAKKGTQELNLQNKLSEQIEWLPDSIGKLTSLTTLNISENRLLILPISMAKLSALQKLDLRSNKITEIPDSISDLLNLITLDISGNQIKTLPQTITKLTHLEELILSSNYLSSLPDTIGSLTSLKKLIVETNNLEEFPHTIGQCTTLKELRADYNRLKALPEAIGRISSLEILSVRYNNIRSLPTTMSSMSSLKQLDISFNECEGVPESLCFAITLTKMNISNNFADMSYLPRSIGNLENLEELDMSNNQIRNFPDSFRMLSKLQVLKCEGNPLEFPPQSVIDLGAQAVVQYVADLVAEREVKAQPVKQKKTWAQICFFSRSNKRKRNGNDYLKT